MSIKGKGGRGVVLRPKRQKASPLDIPGLNLRLTRKEIVEFVRSGRGTRRWSGRCGTG